MAKERNLRIKTEDNGVILTSSENWFYWIAACSEFNQDPSYVNSVDEWRSAQFAIRKLRRQRAEEADPGLAGGLFEQVGLEAIVVPRSDLAKLQIY